MKKQLQGIALILFGILLVLVALVDPWVPIIEGASSGIILLGGIVSGIAGVAMNFEKEN